MRDIKKENDYRDEEKYYDNLILNIDGCEVLCNCCGECSSIEVVEFDFCSSCNRWVCIKKGIYRNVPLNQATVISSIDWDDGKLIDDEDMINECIINSYLPHFIEFFCFNCIQENDYEFVEKDDENDNSEYKINEYNNDYDD